MDEVLITPAQRQKGAALFCEKRTEALADTLFSNLEVWDQQIWIMRADLEEWVDRQPEILERVDLEVVAIDLHLAHGYFEINGADANFWYDTVADAIAARDPIPWH